MVKIRWSKEMIGVEPCWSGGIFQITKTKFGWYRVWNTHKLTTVDICDTLKKAKQVAENES